MGTGIIRRLDDLGRISLPKNVREMLTLQDGDPIEISVQGNKVVLEKYNSFEGYVNELKNMCKRATSDTNISDDEKLAILKAVKSSITKLR